MLPLQKRGNKSLQESQPSLTFQDLLQREHCALEEPHDHRVALVLANVDLERGLVAGGLPKREPTKKVF